MSSMRDVRCLMKATGKRLTGIKEFPSSKVAFRAYNDAEARLEKQGYIIGPMCCNEPTAASRRAWGVAKWKNIPRTDWDKIEAMIVGSNLREGPVTIVYLEKNHG